MSVFTNEKSLSLPKYCIREHHDERTDDNNREKTHIDPIPIDEIHTINNWEDADLGDEERKQKFLRLMGAKKRKDSNPTENNDGHSQAQDLSSTDKKHCRSKTETESINRDLEKQFNESLQSTILHTHHEGFGFHGNESERSFVDSHEKVGTKFVRATTDESM